MKYLSAGMLILLALATPAHGADAPAQPVLVLGVYGTEGLANDPNDTHSIAEFTHNFGKIVTLTHRKDGEPVLLDKQNKKADLSVSIREDLNGKLSDYSRRMLEPLRGAPQETLIAHSWGAMAVLYAIRDGVIPPPKRLVIVNPPLVSPEGTGEWRALAERHPDLSLDVYIGTDDFLQRGRRLLSATQTDSETGWQKDASPGDALVPFLLPNAPARVRVRMYPGDHRLLGFFDFVSRKGEYGLKPRAVGGTAQIPGPAAPAFIVKDLFPTNGARSLGKTPARSGYGYLFDSGPGLARAQAFARIAGIERAPQTRELLQARAERSVVDLAKARWEYAALLVATACETPYVLREHEARGLVPGVSLPLSDLRLGYERARRSMSACENEIFTEIIAKPGTLNIRDLADRGERYRHQHNPARVAGRAIGDLFSSIGRALAAPIEKLAEALESSGSPSSSSNGGSERGGYSSRGRDSDFRFESHAFNQLHTGNYRWN
jgi:hypothetical protein